MQTWEMVTAVGSMQKSPMRLLCLTDVQTQAERAEWLTAEFRLEPGISEIIDIAGASTDTSEKELMHLRDVQVVQAADVIIPVSLRRGGAMMKLVEQARDDGKEIVDDFMCEYTDRSASLAYTVSPDDINPDLSKVAGHYLFHWTRANNSAWPGERLLDFYRAVIESERYPRTAFDTLNNIIGSRKLIASSRHMPERIPTVSFTALAPEEAAPLMRWRARFSQMSFEPYGIGIATEACVGLGISPVRYYDRSTSVSRNADDSWLSQSIGTVTDWRQEKEYRHRGDLLLSDLPTEQMIVVCCTHEEAREVEARYRVVRAIAFCRG